MKYFYTHKRTHVGIALMLCVFFVFGGYIQHTQAQSSALNQAQVDRAALEAQLSQLEAEIAQKMNDLKNQQGQSETISRDITILKTKIDQAKLNIKAKGLVITKLGGEISEKNQTIEELNVKIDKEKESLAQLIRRTNEIDNASFIHLALSKKSLSGFYGDLDSFASIKESVKKSVDDIKGTKNQTEDEKKKLEKKKDDELSAKAALEEARRQVELNQAEQKKLLAVSKQKEKDQQSYIADQQKKVGEIKAKLFQFAGGASPIRFDAALGYAQTAEAKTGVTAAFVLAILTQESNLGSNVGKCYLTDVNTGAGVGVSNGKIWPNLMKPTRDVQPFLDITNKLGFNAFKTVVSCPIAGVKGYGGAMGPAQFIPSTWKLFESRIAAATGSSPVNPWAPLDAFMASAMYLGDLGASAGTYASEIRAACKYYGSGGTSCAYGKSVMGLKAKIQDDIDYLKQYGVSRR